MSNRQPLAVLSLAAVVLALITSAVSQNLPERAPLSTQWQRARLEGVVTDGTKQVQGALAVADDFESVWQIKTNADGEFSLLLPAGCYDVLVSASVFHPYVKRICVVRGEVKKLYVKLKRDNSPRLPISAAAEAQSGESVVEGVVMEEHYFVIPALQIQLVGKQTYETRSDSTGHFRFANILDGDYTLKPATPMWVVAHDMETLHIRGGGELMHVDLVLRDNRPPEIHVVHPDN